MLSVGNVVEVWVPDDGCEAARDLSRALDDAREDLKRRKQRLSKFLLRHGYVFSETTPTGRRKGSWTAAHWAYESVISFPEKADNDVLAYYVDAVRQAMEDKARLERLVEAEASKPRWKRRVDSVRCLKGIDVTSAADLVFEAGEFSRFKSARSFAAWLGLTPSEHSSGESVRQGGITKAGNKHLRRVLVESAWHYLGCSPHSKDLAKGQVPDPAARRHAAKGVRRLVERRRAMLERGVHKNKANVATARELACWCWAVGRMTRTASLREGRAGIALNPSHPAAISEAVGANPSLFFPRAPKAPPATRDCRIDRGSPSRSNGLPSAEMRHGRILNCKDERRRDTPRSPQEG